MTIRELIDTRRLEIQNSTALTPERAAQILVELSALYGTINEEIRKRDMEYNKVLLKCLEEETKANRAKIRAEISDEYQAKRIARDTKEVCEEMIRSLKYYLRSEEDELRHVSMKY